MNRNRRIQHFFIIFLFQISAAKNLVDQLKQSDFNDGIYCEISSDVNKVMEKYFGAVDSESRIGVNDFGTQEAD